MYFFLFVEFLKIKRTGSRSDGDAADYTNTLCRKAKTKAHCSCACRLIKCTINNVFIYTYVNGKHSN